MKGPSGVANVRDYGCAKVRRLLDSYLAGELTVETNHEILDHLARCLDCAGELAAREKLRSSVRRVSSGLAGEPSAAFQERLQALIARTPPPSRIPAPAMVLAAAVLCGAAGLAVVAYRGFQHRSAGDVASTTIAFDAGALPAAARTQTDCALRSDWRGKAATLPEMAQKVGAPYASALPELARRLPGYTIIAGHRCSHGGREVVHFVLAKNGDPSAAGIVSAIVMPKRGSLPPARLVVADHLREGAGGPVTVTASRERGFDIASVELDDVVVFVVSSRGPKENLELSRAILPGLVTAALTRG